MRTASYLCTILLFCFCSLAALEDKPPHLMLKGFLGKEELTNAHTALDSLAQSSAKQLIIEVNSSSGDLVQVLDLARTIYELKYLQGLQVIVYIDVNALGPAATIPFLADELYVSPFVSWGDIPLGTEGIVPTNILRNRVRSLLVENQPNAALLGLLADAMSDPSVGIVEDKGWKPVKEMKDTSTTISPAGQTLVVNQNQLKRLNLIKGTLLLKDFESRFHLASSLREAATIPSATEISPLAIPKATFEELLKKHIPYNENGRNKIGYIAINDRGNAINQATWLYVKQALDYYKQHKPIFIILELNTPGGEVFAAQRISDALKELDTQYDIPVVAFINNWAISAGAMIAYSCRFITVVKDGSMGAAEPVYASQEGQMVAASEKVNSALRADFASRATFFDRNPLIAEAMVDKDIILVLRHNKIVKLESENQIRTTGPNPDTVITPKGKLLTLTAEQLIQFGVADIILPPEKVDSITPEEKEKGVWPANKMTLFHASFFNKIPQATIEAYQMDWKTQFFTFLASPLISSLLFMGLLVGAYIEINTPGFGVAGTLAATCLFLIILSSFSLELANWLEFILFLTGLVIVLIELFVLPTAGFLGIIGGILLIVGLFGMMLPIGSVGFEYDTQTLNAAGEYFVNRLAWLCAALLLSVAIIIILARYVLPTFSRFNPFVLKGNEQEGFIAVESSNKLPQPGAEGTAFATLRPGGKVLIGETIYDAISEGGFIEAGTPVVVVHTTEGLVIVSPKSEDTRP